MVIYFKEFFGLVSVLAILITNFFSVVITAKTKIM